MQLRHWQKQKNTLLSASSDKWALRGLKDGKYPDLEKELVKYVHELRNNCSAVTHTMLACRALPRNSNIYLTDFIGGRGWFTKFIKRNNFSLDDVRHFAKDYQRITGTI